MMRMDIVGGIGSHPILGNPHYHQSHDVLETINQQLVAEVSKTTVASLMQLASSPSRVNDVVVRHEGDAVVVRWTQSPETAVHRGQSVGDGGIRSWDWRSQMTRNAPDEGTRTTKTRASHIYAVPRSMRVAVHRQEPAVQRSRRFPA